MTRQIHIQKNSGEWAVYNHDKLVNSLRRSRAEESLVQEIAQEVGNKLSQGMTTRDIYRMAFKMLKSRSRVSASRYTLKKALMELGPSGFPFERFVGKILEYEGFQTQVGVVVKGQCVTHEVDVIAQKDNHHYMVECKYHSDPGRHCDVKIPLYIHSRFLDVEKQWASQPGHSTKFHQGWLITNTRFTTDAIAYGKCAGLKMVSWDYPVADSLRKRIDQAGLHPLTALTTLTKSEKTTLLGEGIVLCRQVADNPKLLLKAGISKARIKNILEDSRALCKTSAP